MTTDRRAGLRDVLHELYRRSAIENRLGEILLRGDLEDMWQFARHYPECVREVTP